MTIKAPRKLLRHRVFGLVAILSLILAACAAEEETTTTAAATDTEQVATTTTAAPTTTTTEPLPTDVVISFQNWYFQATMKEAYDQYIGSFLAQNDRVIEGAVETQPYPRYHDVLNVKLSANQTPEVSWIKA